MAIQSKLLPPVAGWSLFSLTIFALSIRQRGRQQSLRIHGLDSLYLPKKHGRGKKIAVNREFWGRLWYLLRILIPSWKCPVVGYGMLVAGLLMARTSFDITIMKITTAIERAIISRSVPEFQAHLTKFFMIMIPVSMVNCLLKYGQTEMTLHFRTRLSKYLYAKYLHGFIYYKVSNLDNRISNADQLLTQDVERFCHSVSELYSNLTKPLLDILIYSYRLSYTVGKQGPMRMLSYLVVSGMVLTWLRQPTGRFTVAEQKLEGHFRYMNTRLISHSEEIAFYHGQQREKHALWLSFERLMNVLRVSQQFRYSIGFIDNIVAKYFATVVGFYVVSRPFLNLQHPRHQHTTHAERMEDYFRSGRMMIKLSEAMGRLVLAGRELTRLAGFTNRVTELIQVLSDLGKNQYQRTMVKSTKDKQDRRKSNSVATAEELQIKPNDGIIMYQDHVIDFQKVPLVTPNGDVLVKSMSFQVKAGMNVLVCGPNGCGKSSLFRILGELWPMFGGTLIKPTRNNLFYIPQRPYLTLGTLRDQIIYPHSKGQMKNQTDDDLYRFLQLVHLEYLLERDGQWDAVQDWADVLSGGEKQRIAMARLFYHAPQFAILDECTSAVSVDIEGMMYSHCRTENITLFTVSHRQSLWKYHDYVLKFDGRGHYNFEAIDPNNSQQIFGS